MPKMSQITIQPDPPSDKPVGSRNEKVLQSIFKSSPIYSKQEIPVDKQGTLKLTPQDQKQWYLDHVVNGNVPSSAKPVN